MGQDPSAESHDGVPLPQHHRQQHSPMQPMQVPAAQPPAAAAAASSSPTSRLGGGGTAAAAADVDLEALEDRLLVVTGRFRGITVLDWQTGEVRAELRSTYGRGLLIHGRTLYHGERRTGKVCSTAVNAYDIPSRRKTRSFTGPRRGLMSIALSSHRSLLFGGSMDHNVYVWDVNSRLGDTAEPRTILSNHEHQVTGLGVSEVRPWVASVSTDATYVWDFGHQKKIAEVKRLSLNQGTTLRWDLERDLLFVGGGFASRVKAFSDTFECVRTLEHGKNAVYAMCFFGHAGLITSDAEGVVRMWDLRRCKDPVSMKKIHEDIVWSISPFEKSFVATVSRDKYVKVSKFSSSMKCSLKRTIKLHGGREPLGVLALSNSTLWVSPSVGTIPDCAETILALLSFRIDTIGHKFTTSRSLLSKSALIAASRSDEGLQLVGIPNDGVEIDPEALLLTLLGQDDVPGRTLFGLYSLFCALDLKKLAYAACAAAEKISDIRVLVEFCRASCPQLSSSDDDADWERFDAYLTLMVDLSPFAECVLRRLQSLGEQVLQDSRASSVLSSHGYLGACIDARWADAWDRPLRNHPMFAGVDSHGLSFSAVFDDTCAHLFRTRVFSNLTLRAVDGHEEKVHLEVLMSRSEYFCNVFKFGGTERASLIAGHPVQLERFDREVLKAFISWIYLRTIPEDLPLSVLLRLFVHALMVDDGVLIIAVKKQVVCWAAQTEPKKVILQLFDVGWRLFELPEKRRDRFFTVVSEIIKSRKWTLVAIAEASLEVKERSIRGSSSPREELEETPPEAAAQRDRRSSAEEEEEESDDSGEGT